MRNVLSPDSRFMILITRLAYSAYLSILWLICCIPILTIGASTTALFTVTLKMVRNEEGNVTPQFFAAFKANFRQSTIVWLILLLLGLVLAADGYTLYHLRFESPFWTVLTAIYFVVLAAYAIVTMYIYPLMAHFDNTIPAMFRNSLMIGMRFLMCTAIMAAIYFFMACIVINLLTPLILFAEGLCAFFCSFVLSGVLTACEGKKEDDDNSDPALPEEKE